MKLLEESLSNFIEELTEDTKIEKNVEKELSLKLKTYLNDFLFILQGTESPIERLFAINLVYMFRQSTLKTKYEIADIDSQSTLVMESEKEYRVDFLVHLADPVFRNVSFVIECDGHEFHEKTKEQVRKDKERERDLQRNGYFVIRFSGSEIHKNPMKCAVEAIEIMKEFCKKYA